MLPRWSILLALLLGLLSPRPAQAASPTETMETFFEQANALLRGADRTRGIEETRQAIRQLVNDVIEFREAAAQALGPAWSSRSPEDQDEFVELFNTILINVTAFFRDEPTWDYLRETIVPAIVENASPRDGIRVWSTGCASGEEPYTLAMLLEEAGLELADRLEQGRHDLRHLAREHVAAVAFLEVSLLEIIEDE